MSLRDRLRPLALWLLFPLAGTLIAAAIYPWAMAEGKKPHAYAFVNRTAANGVKLAALRTRPDNVALRAIDRNVTETGAYGINGGFFYEGALLSIAVMNDRPVQSEPGAYGSGWWNAGYRRGTLVWDEAAGRFSVQVAGSAADLQVTDRSRYWAQGGVSMRLDQPDGWEDAALAEHMPAYNEQRLRSAAVYDVWGYVWLIVTPTPCTIAEFRSAILEQIAPGQLVDGIFLDGDGSSQLAERRHRLAGDGRPVYQMLAVIR